MKYANQINIIDGTFSAPRGNIAIVASRFNEFIVERLIDGAIDVFTRHKLQPEQIELIRVPGGYEIPLAAQAAAESGRYVGVLALGVVIRGATPHFDYVAGGCANGLMNVQLKTNIPMAFGVLTTETVEQAVERAGSKAGNKGADCAVALLEMLSVLEQVRG